MRANRVASVLFLFSALSQTASLHATDTANCGLTKYASLDLIGDLSHSLLVPVTIQDTQTSMLLDTSSALSSMSESSARRLMLRTHAPPRGANLVSGGKVIQNIAVARSLELGDARFKGAEFVVITDDVWGSKVTGVLGMNLFAHLDVEIDMANRKLNLYSPDHCPGRVVYWSKTYDSVPIRLGDLGEYYFSMELDGKQLETTLATGSSQNILPTAVTKELYGFDASSPDIETETDAAGKITSHYRAMKLNAPGLSVINTNITLLESTGTSCKLTSRAGAVGYAYCVGVHPLRLGLSVLTKLHIYIATKERVLYFTPAVVADRP